MGLEFDAGTESDSDVEQEETCAQGKSAGKTVLAGSSSRDKHARKEAARVRRQDIDQMARVMDMEAEEAAEDAEWPPIFFDQNARADPQVRYPPLPVAKVGRPKGTKRIRRHDEGGPSGRPNKKARRV